MDKQAWMVAETIGSDVDRGDPPRTVRFIRQERTKRWEVVNSIGRNLALVIVPEGGSLTEHLRIALRHSGGRIPEDWEIGFLAGTLRERLDQQRDHGVVVSR